VSSNTAGGFDRSTSPFNRFIEGVSVGVKFTAPWMRFQKAQPPASPTASGSSARWAAINAASNPYRLMSRLT